MRFGLLATDGVRNCCVRFSLLAMFASVVGCSQLAADPVSDESSKPVPDQPALAQSSTPDSKPHEDVQTVAVPAGDEAALPTVAMGFSVPAVDGELTIANPAPKLTAASFPHGKPFKKFENGKIYVVEFWATWCGPCLQGMPHLGALADKYRKDVHFVGVTNEDEETVQRFLERKQSADKTWAEVITYTLAIDDDEKTNQNYMAAAGEDGIPTAFIVGRDGVVEWIGSPFNMDGVLAAVVENRYDRKGSYESIAAELAVRRVRQAAEKAINAAVAKKDYKTAVAEVDKLLKSNPDELNLSMVKMDLLRRGEMTDELNALQAQLVKQQWDEPKFLEVIAWGIADENTGDDLDLAMKSALRASALTKDSNSSILDTVARVHYAQGNLEEAVQWQAKSVSAHGNKGAGTDLPRTLKKYQEELAAQKKKSEDATSNEEPKK